MDKIISSVYYGPIALAIIIGLTYTGILFIYCTCINIERKEKKMSMIKHKFVASGVDSNETLFEAICIDYNITDAIKLLEKKGLFVRKIEKSDQVERTAEIGIISLEYKLNLILAKNFKVNLKPEYIGNKVYVTFTNEFRSSISGVYANPQLAAQEAKIREDMDIVESYEVHGSRMKNFSIEIYNNCKYYKPKIETIRALISCLYELDGCCTGGIAHIVVDDNNYEDHHLQFVIDECNKEENKDREEVGLAKLICEELLKLSIQERALLYSGYYSYSCDGNCENCQIEKGKYDYDEEI